MTLDRSLAVAVGLAAWLASVLVAEHDASAQLSADPYKPYNAQYEQYIYPSYPNELSVAPNQSLLTPRSSSALSYQRFLEEEDEMGRAASNAGPPMRGRRGIGVPYYRAYRDYDAAYGRVYSPNQTADKKYLANRQSRDDVYAEYLQEKDPKKKATLLKEYKEYNQRALRDLYQGRGAPSRRAPARAEAPLRARPPVPGVETPRDRRGPAVGSSAPSPSAATPSNSDILRRSEALDRPTRPRPALPTVPSPRPEADASR